MSSHHRLDIAVVVPRADLLAESIGKVRPSAAKADGTEFPMPLVASVIEPAEVYRHRNAGNRPCS